MGKSDIGDSWPPKSKEDSPKESIRSSKVLGILCAIGTFFAFAIMGVTGRFGVANIDSREIGVVVNYVTRTQTPILTPGYQFYIPFLQEIFIFDRSQQKFMMQGSDYVHDNLVPELTVRASDGSSFYFEEMPIQYQIRPENVEILLADAGRGDDFKREWVKAHARSILRDEFGRFTAIQAANPTVFAQARLEAKRRLNEVLEPHGIEVVLIGTPNPKFDQAYEMAIEDRKSADQEVERLAAKLEQLVEERDRKLAAVTREKSVEMQELTGELKKELLSAERQQIEMEKSADAYAQKRTLEGEAQLKEKSEEARGKVERYTKEAEGIKAQTLALENRGEVVVWETLVEKLRSVKFTLVPYSRDPAPKRLEHVDALGTTTLVDESITGEGN